ncbi:MAG TPA: hypothetical protein VMI52_00265 [Acetobacteraceae bacterium]|nr:hypothetical protein [Acetobacteraceae bacterium]
MAACSSTTLQLVIAAAVLAGCATGAKPSAGPSQIKFEVTDLSNTYHPSSVISQTGQTVNFPIPFNVVIRTVGTDQTGVRALLIYTTSYTAGCDGTPIEEAYRTKRIVLPEGVTSEPSTATRQSYKLPLDTFTLLNLGLCSRPAPTSFHLRARVLNGNAIWSGSDLTIRIGGAPVRPAKSS